ncbi:hypothetical protein PQX77_017002 [Marasmius sp. AFHP31]|nr:hypothetical protein PQX77_017002 [Marasmius sp. AFHP31]
MSPVRTSPTESAPLTQQQNSQPSPIFTTAFPSILHAHSLPPLPSTSEGPSQPLNLVSATAMANPGLQRAPPAVEPNEGHEGHVEHEEIMNKSHIKENKLSGAGRETESGVELDSRDSSDESGDEFGGTDSGNEFE